MTARLDAAVLSFIGRGRSASPVVSWHAAGPQFDHETRRAAERVVMHLDAIEIDPKVPEWDAERARVRAVLSEAFPDLEPQTVDALMWKFDYDWK